MSTTQPIRDIEKIKLFESYYKEVKPHSRNYMMIVLGLNSALRISDILHLTYGDVCDYQRNTWKKHIVVKEQKTGKINRIYMNSEIRKVLEEYSDYSSHTASDWLFQSQMPGNQPLSRYLGIEQDDRDEVFENVCL